MSFSPSHLLHVRPDTLGDLILFSAAIEALRREWPEARHTLLVRPGYDALAPLFAPEIQWRTVAINPFRQGPAECRSTLEELLRDLEKTPPDLILGATTNRTWLETALAAHFPKARRVALGSAQVDPLFATALRLDRQVDLAQAFPEFVSTLPEARDWENNHRLVEHLAGGTRPRLLPKLTVPAKAVTDARAWLDSHELPTRGWVALFPGGLANVPIKAYPPSHFAALATALGAQTGLKPVLVGHTSDESVLDAVEAAAGHRITRWVGRDGDLPVLAALLADAAAYLGHDTGAMHLAAAVDTPTLGYFGGGHWPRFRPVGPKVGAVIHPLPCFNCNWDCHFSSALCVRSVTEKGFIDAALTFLATPGPCDVVYTQNELAPALQQLIADTAPRFRALQEDRLARQHKIEELKRETNGKDVEISALKQSAEDRKQEMEAIKAELEAECDEKDAEITQLKHESNGKDEEITALKRSAEERKQEMEAIKAELEAECDGKDTEIAQLKNEANGKDGEIEALKLVCNEREALIITQDKHIKNFQAILAHKEVEEKAHAARLAAAEAAAEQVRAHFAALPPEAAQWGRSLHDKDVHIRNLDALLYAKEKEKAELAASLTNLQNGLYQLEGVKFFGQQLAEKEAVLQTLHRACQDREKVIQQLALTNLGVGRLHKIWLATCAHVELKYWKPLKEWAFKKVVEQYWMQIGILRHYAPRPLRWDKIPRPRREAGSWPAFGIVTPSYGQQAYIESTMLSVLNQGYPNRKYVVQDGGSKDQSPAIIARHAPSLFAWESVRDRGQADAIHKGFQKLEGHLGPNDLMAWLNSDDFIAPRALQYVADYFEKHPDVDVVYGHRIIIDGEDREVGRWIMPPHDPATLEWIDYVPQETLFWRKRAWDKAGGIDPSFQFALDWDLLARFQQTGAKIVRLPYALGAFRVHAEQKTSQQIHTIGNEEMIRIRRRFHGDNHSNGEIIHHYARKTRFLGALTARLAALGIRL